MVRVARPRPGESGHALVTALFVLLLVSLAAALVAASLNLGLRAARDESQGIAATALADAAVAETLAHLWQNPDFRGVSERAYGGGRLGSRVTRSGTRSWSLRAWSEYGKRQRAVRLHAMRTPDGKMILSGWRRVPGGPG